jgi:phosphoglucomutase
MAAEVEIVGVTTRVNAQALPVADAVIGTTADTGMSVTLSGQLRRTQYMTFAAGTTHILSTAAYIDRLVVVPVSTGAGVVTLSDGTTAILSIPAASHAIDPHTYSVPLGITNTSTAGFKLVLGASVSAIAVGAFVGVKTTA